MHSCNVAEVKTRLSEILRRVSEGQEILLTRRGRPIARLIPVATRTSNILGAGKHDPNINFDVIARNEWWKSMPDDETRTLVVIATFSTRAWWRQPHARRPAFGCRSRIRNSRSVLPPCGNSSTKKKTRCSGQRSHGMVTALRSLGPNTGDPDLQLPRKDPYDRILMTQSVVEKMPLVTADEEISSTGINLREATA